MGARASIQGRKIESAQQIAMKVLFVFSNPAGDLRFDREAKAIDDAVRPARGPTSIEPRIIFKARVKDLRQALGEDKYGVVHFSGHGSSQGLTFEDDEGREFVPDMKALADVLGDQAPALQCVVFNACSALPQAELASFGVPWTIAMDGPIHDGPATAFTTAFYACLAKGVEIPLAYEHGEQEIRLHYSDYPAPQLIKGKPKILIIYDSDDYLAAKQLTVALRAKDYGTHLETTTAQTYTKDIDSDFALLKHCAGVVACIGSRSEPESWDPGLVALLTQAQERRISVIPTALSDSAADLHLPPFLRTTQAVRLGQRADAEAVQQLLTVIHGTRPIKPPSLGRPDPRRAAPPGDGQLSQAINTLSESILDRDTVYFAGRGLFDSDENQFYQNVHFSRELLGKLDIEALTHEIDLRAPPHELAAACYAIRKSHPVLDMAIAEHYRAPGRHHTATASGLARLVRCVCDRRELDTGRRQLIVTTTLYDLLERALVAEGVSFSRVVQYRQEKDEPLKFGIDQVEVAESRDSITVSCNGTHTPVSREALHGLRFPLPNLAGTQPLLDNKLKGVALKSVILYKPLGSSDRAGSCTSSVDQYLRFAAVAANYTKWFPTALTGIMAVSPAIFLGCNLLDTDSLLIYHSLLRRVFSTGTDGTRRYAAASPPSAHVQTQDFARLLEASLWVEIGEHALETFGIRLISVPPEQFVAELVAKLGGAGARGDGYHP